MTRSASNSMVGSGQTIGAFISASDAALSRLHIPLIARQLTLNWLKQTSGNPWRPTHLTFGITTVPLMVSPSIILLHTVAVNTTGNEAAPDIEHAARSSRFAYLAIAVATATAHGESAAAGAVLIPPRKTVITWVSGKVDESFVRISFCFTFSAVLAAALVRVQPQQNSLRTTSATTLIGHAFCYILWATASRRCSFALREGLRTARVQLCVKSCIICAGPCFSIPVR